MLLNAVLLVPALQRYICGCTAYDCGTVDGLRIVARYIRDCANFENDQENKLKEVTV